MSKYNALWEYIQKQELTQLELTFEEIEKVLGFRIDHAFLLFKKELISYGYQVEKISLKNKKILFLRIHE